MEALADVPRCGHTNDAARKQGAERDACCQATQPSSTTTMTRLSTPSMYSDIPDGSYDCHGQAQVR
jgi:hypothetical protein